MKKEDTYKCKICGKIMRTSDKKIPICCGKLMKKFPLEVCLQPAHAEHARPMMDEDACDEGRAG